MQPQGIDLSGLKDIHLPAVPSLWPLPAVFWIVLAALLCCIFLARWIWIKKHEITAKKYANREVESITKRFSGNSYKTATDRFDEISASGRFGPDGKDMASIP